MTAVAATVVFIAFTAPACGPCKRLKRDFEGSNAITMLNVEENQELAESYEINAFPTVIALVDEKEVSRTVGYNNKAELEAWMARVRDRNQ